VENPESSSLSPVCLQIPTLHHGATVEKSARFGRCLEEFSRFLASSLLLLINLL